MYPSVVPAAGDLNADEWVVCLLVDSVVAVPDDGAIYVLGYDEDQWCRGELELLLHWRGIEQSERKVEGFAEAAVVVVVDFSGVHDGAKPQPLLGLLDDRPAYVVVGQEPGEGGDGLVEQDGFGCLVDRVDECKDAVAAVGEGIPVMRADSGRLQGLFEQIVGGVPQVCLDRVGAGRRAFDVDRHDRAVSREA